MTDPQTDIEALERALAAALDDPDSAAQIADMLECRDRLDVAKFASYHEQ
jgi:hypothetical protein